MKLLTTTIATLLAGAVFNASAAVTLNVSNGILMGANNVNVNGVLYNVEFTDNDITTLMPPTQNFDAQAASQALLDQVFVGVYDNEPDLTNGCGFSGFCGITTLAPKDPIYDRIEYLANNYSGLISNGYSIFSDNVTGYANYSFTEAANSASDDVYYTNALWTVAAVPEPSSFAMLLMGGLAALSISRKRKCN